MYCNIWSYYSGHKFLPPIYIAVRQVTSFCFLQQNFVELIMLSSYFIAMLAKYSRYNLINKCCLGSFIVRAKSRVSCSSYLRFRCGFCTSRKVRSSQLTLNRKTCSTGLQRTAGTATSRSRTVGGCTMTNVASRTSNLITTMRPTRRRRQVSLLSYCS